MRPQTLIRRQCRRIGREALDLDPVCGPLREERVDEVTAMKRRPISDGHQVVEDLAPPVLQKSDDVCGLDRLLLALERLFALRRASTDGREVMAGPPLLRNGGVAGGAMPLIPPAGALNPLADGGLADLQGFGDLALGPAFLLELPGLETSGGFPDFGSMVHARQCSTEPPELKFLIHGSVSEHPMARRVKPQQAENHERWLVSYADFITLLFAFFVVMYGISAVDAKKMKQVAQSFQQAFNVVGTGGIGTIPIIEADFSHSFSELPSVQSDPSFGLHRMIQREQEELHNLEQTIQDALEAPTANAKLVEMVHVYVDEQGLIISLSAKYFFDSGRSVLRSEVLPIIEQIATILKPLDREIRIEGHTDDVPIQTTAYPSNWELSAARSTYVIKYLMEKFGFSPQRLSAVGYGEFRPIASNATEDGRARNRRVDIVVLARKIIPHLSIPQIAPVDSQQ